MRLLSISYRRHPPLWKLNPRNSSLLLTQLSDMAANLKQDEVEVELRSPDRRRKLAIVNKNGLTSMEIQEYKEVFEVTKPTMCVFCVCKGGMQEGGVPRIYIYEYTYMMIEMD